MKIGKKNHVSLNPIDYNIGLIGESGSGKTTLIKEAMDIAFSDLDDPADGYLFLETGHEDGADAIEGINYVSVPKWVQAYDEDANTIGFSNLVNDIIENKNEEYPDLKVIVVDTYDELRRIATEEVIRLHNKQHPDKRVQSVKAAFGGFMAGEDMADDIVIEKLWALKAAGVQFWIIGHTKMKSTDDVMTDEKFERLTTDMPARPFNKIKNKLHALGVLYLDRTFEAKDGDSKTKKISTESRMICFRDDNYNIDSKSRFAEIAPYVELDAQAFLDTIRDAAAAAAKVGGNTDKQIKENQKKKDETKKKVTEKARENHVNTERNSELVDLMTMSLKDISDADKKSEILAALREIDPTAKNFKPLLDAPTSKVEEIYKLFEN